MLILIFVFIGYLGCRTLYRLYWHPLRRFPGPKLAATSRMYEFYHNVVHNGRYLWKIEELHKQYGSILRVGPNELHISDPTYFSEIYAGNSRKRGKDKYWLRMLITLSDSIAATGEHDLHLKRRNHLLRHFSKKSVMEIEPRIKPSIEKTMKILEQKGNSGEIFAIDSLLIAMGTDVISEYIFGNPLGFLDNPGLNNTLRDVLHSMSHYGPLMTFIPFGDKLRYIVPTSLLARLSSHIRVILENERLIRDICARGMQSLSASKKSTLFSSLNDPKIPLSERSLDRVTAESILFLLGGLKPRVTMFHLLSDQTVFLKLRDEVKQVLVHPTDYPSWTALEALPYLRAVIQEGLRLALVVVNRLALVATEETLVYKDWEIPPGTAVGQSMWFVHMNEEIYPEPRKFKPERWLSAEKQGRPLEKYFVPFLQGARDCMGKNLAYAELYVTVALLVRRFDMELYETGLPDVMPYRDGVITHQADGSQGVRVRVTKMLTE
ncbi:uncharacterized protein N7482_006398 [Penicillium canariense]|uniref:Cytochrome P450 n=1 Tax=Penicillium canariense TaxID=189055 RepID=A0A9W9LJ51_9EURO|nr:uncharacterized protein N7482_006398 [Penicillium canariense]KAJ5159394.1 hypothetical protein N7482_006398 [Penicillium canariense]